MITRISRLHYPKQVGCFLREVISINNVKNTVSRHDGELIINQTDCNFTVEITLKI